MSRIYLRSENLSLTLNLFVHDTIYRFTAVSHVAGTEGDRLSALRVKDQWEELLGLPLSGPDANVLESGTEESREALQGKRYHHHGYAPRWRLGKRRWFRKLFGNKRRGIWGRQKPRVWVDTYYPVSRSLGKLRVGS